MQPKVVRLGPLEAMAEASRPFSLDGRGGGGEQRERLLCEAQLVCCTLSGAGMDTLRKAHGGRGMVFDVVVVDEATQSTEPELLIALQHGAKLCSARPRPPHALRSRQASPRRRLAPSGARRPTPHRRGGRQRGDAGAPPRAS